MTVNVTSVNDAPTAAASSVTTNEDTDKAFAATDFSFTDASDSPANGLLAVTVTSLPVNGSLLYNGSAVTVPKTVSAADLGLGKRKSTRPNDSHIAPSSTFKFIVQDDGGTANGGADASAN